MYNAVYLDRVKGVKDCYIITTQTVEVRLQHVLSTGIKLDKATNSSGLPRGLKNKEDMIKNGLYRMRSQDVEDISQEIRCRESLDHIEERDMSSDDDGNSSTDDGNPEEIDNESDL